MKEKLLFCLAVIALIGAIWGFFVYMERYALCEEVKKIEQKFDYKFKIIEIKGVNERIWQLEDRLKKNPNDKSASEELKKLREDKDTLKEELKKIGEKR